MRALISSLLVAVAVVAAQDKQTFMGTITDEMCPAADHSRMRMGPTDAECAVACANDHGVTFLLYDGKQALGLSDQKAAEPFAGTKVTVTGTLDAKTNTIRVESIKPAR